MNTIATIKSETLQFLKDLKKNNNRDWFNENKDRFIAANENIIQFTQVLIERMTMFDKSLAGLNAKECIFRIYADMRFSKDKLPYKTHFAVKLMNESKGTGYFFRLGEDESYLVGGAHITHSSQLQAIRERISKKGEEFLKIVNDKAFKQNFVLEGEKLQKIPNGFDKEDPMGEYLKFKTLMIKHQVNEEKILSDDFADYCVEIFKDMMPFNAFLNVKTITL